MLKTQKDVGRKRRMKGSRPRRTNAENADCCLAFCLIFSWASTVEEKKRKRKDQDVTHLHASEAYHHLQKSVTAGGQLGTIMPCHASARAARRQCCICRVSKHPHRLLMPVIRLTCSFGNGLVRSPWHVPRIHCVHTICHERGDVQIV